MKKEQVIAEGILEHVGGKENIRQLAHCMTRVRLQLKDSDKVNIASLKKVDGVMGVIDDETLQIVVGPGTVNKVSDVLSTMTGLKIGEVAGDDDLSFEEKAQLKKANIKKKNNTPLKNFLRKIGNIFIPLIPGLVASGLINGAANFAKNAGVDEKTTIMQILLVLGSCIFTYLAVLVGWNTAKEFGGTPVLGAIAGMFLFNPGLAEIHIFGDALMPGRGGLFGVIFAAWLMVVIEKQVRKIIPNSIDIILTPLITVLIVAILSLFVVMPVAGVLTDGITSGIKAILDIGGVVAGAILAGFFLPLVMVGLHQGLTPIHLEFMNQFGNTPLLPVLAMAGAGQVGAAIAIFVKTKNKRLRNIIKGGLPAGFLGIGEPLLYGVTLPLGRPFITACLGAAVGGAFQAVFHVAAKSIGVSGLSLTMLIDDNKYILYLIGIVIAYAFGFLFTYLFGFKEKMAEDI
ncbi:PTS transporter subunit EIIC [Heyndrickxia sporothermodurans]|uniref:PTS system, N-acetylmuramic acid-specific IIB component n=4 Tax=Heyndrickxia sporothermodurans TaxID=46224 RepID=A0A150L746_9BACI|nr:PTS transporter subunit EIIC [Heyndrickxia sporothermodurans]KYD07826.1 PTS system, N-acetylmuramic acid-specific IIB component [Heyndrickxia sporothermodurans]MEB6551209.1 PTS transporter subunit EIIC [Heyndrickxia sporothermodurans]MED3650491.1 PTS transporter subunit EIIC [Heyndrickxia sporothermodurans]MED3654443.1 PTS transporter subunit EIIC [Heyndrickxia sporothermodurans]MED3698427.1 PTS transporter subunit EIIC [Heyndrickxia sporothermodurans]